MDPAMKRLLMQQVNIVVITITSINPGLINLIILSLPLPSGSPLRVLLLQLQHRLRPTYPLFH